MTPRDAKYLAEQDAAKELSELRAENARLQALTSQTLNEYREKISASYECETAGLRAEIEELEGENVRLSARMSELERWRKEFEHAALTHPNATQALLDIADRKLEEHPDSPLAAILTDMVSEVNALRLEIVGNAALAEPPLLCGVILGEDKATGTLGLCPRPRPCPEHPTKLVAAIPAPPDPLKTLESAIGPEALKELQDSHQTFVVGPELYSKQGTINQDASSDDAKEACADFRPGSSPNWCKCGASYLYHPAERVRRATPPKEDHEP